MAPRVTSSRDRSGRKPAKPTTVTTSKGRGNRSSVSTANVSSGSNGKPPAAGARVTNASQRTSNGSARVTGGSRAALPPGNKGGAVTKPSSNKPTAPRSNGGPVRPVSVRDLDNTKPPQVGGSGGRALPPGQRGGSPAVRPPAATRSSASRPPTGQRGGPLVTRAGARINMGGARGAVVGALGSALIDPLGAALGPKLGDMLKPLGRAIDDRLPGVNSKDEARRTAAKQPLRQMTAQERSKAVRLQQAEPKDMSGRPKPPTVPTLPASVRRAASPTGGSTPSRSSSPTGRSASAPKPGSTTGASKPQSDTAPKPPNLPKVETETSDAPKPPTIGSKPPTERYKRRLGASRQDMIEDNIRRARKKSS